MNLVEGVCPYFLLIRKNQITFVLQGRKPKEARKKGALNIFNSYSLFITCFHVHRTPEYWIGWSFICFVWAREPLSRTIVLSFPLFWNTCCRHIMWLTPYLETNTCKPVFFLKTSLPMFPASCLWVCKLQWLWLKWVLTKYCNQYMEHHYHLRFCQIQSLLVQNLSTLFSAFKSPCATSFVEVKNWKTSS